MTYNTYDQQFWLALDTLVSEHKLVIDRPKGSSHPRFPDIVYQVDYGYLEGTSAMDGDGIDAWRGSRAEKTVSAIICNLDLLKKDSEIKLLIGCTHEELRTIYEFHNQKDFMKGLFIPRPQ